MDRQRDGYVVLLGSIFLVTALFLPGIQEALFPDKELSGWVIAALGAAALFDVGQDSLTTILASLFISNLLFVSCIILYPFLSSVALFVASWLCGLFTVFAIVMTLFFLPNTHFAIGHYLWLTGMGLVTWGFYRKARRSKA
ncbi:MAG: hypothetical protein A2521_05165 [Deltaproteobacteria bacterium RIFOXYD12_FULL_57_12]|nr:MAG: hypothetical protein A2521_05165 [Deltaproteobacteria bacterium RIFOXYD12_FULL_57_12]